MRHSDNHDLHKITAADGVILAHHGIQYVEKLFGKDDIAGHNTMDRDADFPARLHRDHAPLVTKCKNVRIRLRRHAAAKLN
jgi:hypothetical protein